MIVMKAELTAGSIFFVGDCVDCTITFTKEKDCNSGIEQLAWASAQIHCQCILNTMKLKIPKEKLLQENKIISSETSFIPYQGEKGNTVFSTTPKILFCDLKLGPEESYTYILPVNIPPSYFGKTIRYVYKLTIGMQRINMPIKLLRIGIQVLPLPNISLRLSESPLNSQQSEEITPNNPFLNLEAKESSSSLIMNQVQDVIGKKMPVTYNITCPKGIVGYLTLWRHVYRLGEDIIGAIDFSDATVNCVQFLVSLQSEENILGTPYNTTTHSHCHQVTLSLQSTQLLLSIPLHITPSFETDLEKLEMPEDSINSWKAPNEIPVESMIWDLPIHILSINPQHLQTNCNDQLIYTLTL